MKKDDKSKLMMQTAEQLHSTFINETNLPEKNLATEFSCWWIRQSLQTGQEIWSFGAQSIIYYLSSINSIDARIAKAILQPTDITYQTYQLMEMGNKKCN